MCLVFQEKSRMETALNAKIAQYDEDMAARFVRDLSRLLEWQPC